MRKYRSTCSTRYTSSPCNSVFRSKYVRKTLDMQQKVQHSHPELRKFSHRTQYGHTWATPFGQEAALIEHAGTHPDCNDRALSAFHLNPQRLINRPADLPKPSDIRGVPGFPLPLAPADRKQDNVTSTPRTHDLSTKPVMTPSMSGLLPGSAPPVQIANVAERLCSMHLHTHAFPSGARSSRFIS